MPTQALPTKQLYLRDGGLRTQRTKITSIKPLSSLSEADRMLFKGAQETHHVIATAETIFYPQGGGQPSDSGTLSSSDSNDAVFKVSIVRTAPGAGDILHCGHFTSPSSNAIPFSDAQNVEQSIDGAKRDLHSRIHTAGHILGLAVATLKIPDVDEGT
ncbi:hypothetical protein LTS18_001152, partial [Coniosporium uncinatum]